MTAINEDLVDSFLSVSPLPGAAAPALTLIVNDSAVLVSARWLHDGACAAGERCGLRDLHAMDVYERPVRLMLAAMVEASAEATRQESWTAG